MRRDRYGRRQMADGNHTAQRDAHHDHSGEVDDEIDVSFSCPRPMSCSVSTSVGQSSRPAWSLLAANSWLELESKWNVTSAPSRIGRHLPGLVAEMQLQAAEQHARIRSVGVGCAGPVTRQLETVSPVNIAGWQEFPLRRRLRELTRLPVYGDLDAKALALAEGWLGAAQGHPNFCAMTVSTGIGGGIVLDGELLDGESGNAGHVGHIIVEPGGRRCGCGAQGCLEAEASGLAIEQITGRPPTEPTYEIMQRTGTLVGRAAASICNSLDLSLVVVGGAVALGFAATFFHSAQMSLDEHAKLPYSSAGARITPSRLADSGPLIGAGAVGWRGSRRDVRRGTRTLRSPSAKSGASGDLSRR